MTLRRLALPGLLLVLFAGVLVRTSWFCDDAYILFRIADNALHGHGLTWNPGERVMAYTQPLWLLLMTAASAVTGELTLTVHVLSILLSVLAVGLVALGGRGAGGVASAVPVVVLVLSRAFVDYSTSGLENPLSHLLFAGFLASYLRTVRTERGIFPTALLAGLVVTNRMDALLLVGPPLVALVLERRTRRALATAVAGFAPFVAWEAFSLVYYGFLLPNTAYAKLGTGIPEGELWASGWAYLANSATRDPLTLVTIAAGCAVPIVLVSERRDLPVVVGVLLHLLYVARIGGDFMAGRMLTMPLLAAVVLGGCALRRARPAPVVAVGLAALALGFATPRPTLLSGADFGLDTRAVETGDGAGIVEERRFYYRATSLLGLRERGEVPDNGWAHKGLAARAAGPSVVTRRTIGFFGYFAGPEVHVVDLHALADPLLARIPRIERMRGGRWRPGHFRRALPPGYVEKLDGRARALADPGLDRYHEELSRVVRGPLFTAQRWKTIARFLGGRNDELLEGYLATLD